MFTVNAGLWETLLQARLVMFDCDGVLLQSNNVKTDAIAHVFADVDARLRQRCLQTFKQHFGQPRDSHFERFPDILQVASGDRGKFIAEKTAQYRDYLEANYPLSIPVPGALGLCDALSSKGVSTCVITGGVSQEACRALRHNGFNGITEAVFGAPVSKNDHMAQQLRTFGVSADEAVYVGDALSDLEACIRADIPFLFVRDYAIGDLDTIRSKAVEGRSSAVTVANLEADQQITSLHD